MYYYQAIIDITVNNLPMSGHPCLIDIEHCEFVAQLIEGCCRKLNFVFDILSKHGSSDTIRLRANRIGAKVAFLRSLYLAFLNHLPQLHTCYRGIRSFLWFPPQTLMHFPFDWAMALPHFQLEKFVIIKVITFCNCIENWVTKAATKQRTRQKQRKK
ncbi:hypothetical protein [Photobacterium sagamiensis]|uniref:hypothetical protein n=1 Tax=Photobacterium sagamiensis TaxID=2910241 RepID=UPI003D103539